MPPPWVREFGRTVQYRGRKDILRTIYISGTKMGTNTGNPSGIWGRDYSLRYFRFHGSLAKVGFVVPTPALCPKQLSNEFLAKQGSKADPLFKERFLFDICEQSLDLIYKNTERKSALETLRSQKLQRGVFKPKKAKHISDTCKRDKDDITECLLISWPD